MKKTMKRWLAMLLAVLMVMGTLPTSAWAARREEEFAEQPVIGEGDGVTDTLGKHDDGGEYPVDPVDPSAPPVEELDVKDHVTSTSANTSDHILQVVFDNVQAESTFSVAVLPNFRLGRSNATMPTTYAEGDVATYLNSNSDLGGYWASYLSLYPLVAIPHDNSKNYTGKTFTLKWDGTMSLGGEDLLPQPQPGKSQAGKIENVTSQLADWYNKNTQAIYDASGTQLTNPTSLPFKVYMVFGDNSMVSVPIDLPISAQPLKVEIETKDAVYRSRFNYRGTNVSSASTAENGEHLFTEVTLTNTTDTDMTVTVNIVREAVSGTVPKNYGTNTSITDASETKFSATMLGSGYTTGNQTTTATLSQIYGLLDAWNGNPTSVTNPTIKPGQNGKTQTTLTGITVLKNSSKTIYIAGTQGGAATGDSNSIPAATMKNGFHTVQYNSSNHFDFWSSYMITATSTAGPAATASDTGGIRWVENPTTRPKVQLVHGTDVIDPTLDANKGTIMDSQDSTEYTAAAVKQQHSVWVGKPTSSTSKELEWNGTDGYVLPDDVTVSIGARIYVDGWSTNQVTKADDATVQVPMYAVKVTDNEPHDATRKLGSYMWDSTVADTYTVKKVAYNYYPERADVGVYATKTGFSHWTGAASGSLKVPGGSSLLEDSGSKATPGQVTGLSADTDVVANYLQQIKLVTTFNGKDLGKNTVAEPGDRSIEHVFAITLGSASATVDTTGDWTRNNITVQEGTELAWTITPSAAGKYDLVINGIKVTEVDTTNLPKIDGTDYNYVVELVGVIPKVEGTTKAGSTLILPDDLNPARGRDDVTVTGAKPNTGDTPTVLFYPMESDSGVKVRGDVASGDTLSKLNYPSMDDAAKIDVETYAAGSDTKWRLKDGAGGIAIEDTANKKNMKFTASDTNPLVVTFGAADGTAKVTIFVDADESDAPVNADGEVALYKDGKRVTGLTKGDTGVYSGTAGPATYDIYINGNDTGTDIEITAGAEKEATVQYWTVSVSTDGHGKATVTANDKKDLAVDGKTSAEASNATAASIVVIEGTSVTWAFGQANDYYEKKTWASKSPDNYDPITETVGTDTVKTQQATFKKKTAKITVNLQVNGTTKHPGGNQTVTVTGQTDWTTSSDATKEFTVEQGNNYTVALGTFSKTFTALAKDETVNIPFYTLTVEADQTLASSAKVGQSTTDPATADQNSSSVNYLTGTTVYIKAVPGGDNYAFSEWEVQDSKGSKPDPDEATTSVTMTTETHLKAIFTKPKYDTYLKVTLNKNTNVTDGLVSSSDTDKDFVSVTLGTGDGAITATHVGNGVWKAAGVVDATQKDLQWYVTTRAGGPYTADQSPVADRDDATKFAEIKLYSVSTVDTDYDTAQATMTVTGAAGKTRVIVEKGDEIALSVTAADGYTHVSWTEGTASKGTVAKAKYTLTGELTAEQTLTPTFTYIATIVPTVGTTNTVCDVNTVVLTAKDATNTTTTVGTPAKITAEGADKGKWTVTGLTIGTEYAIWVNGHKSDKTVTAIEKVKKVPMWTVSVATTTGGTVALTTTSKLSTTMPNGATYAGWTITATANTANGYRLGDAAGKVWKLTTGGTIGALSGDEIAAPTLSVDNPITGNVVATAYFTQQWTVKSTVDSDKVNSTAKLTDADSGDGTKDSPSTKTIDNTKYVKVTFNRSAGETLDGWTLSNGGAGKWYVGTTPDAEGATWTDWATTAPTKAVESFYFKPSADSTITAAVKTKPYPVKIIVKLDDSDLTDKTTTVPVVKVNNQTLTYSDGAWTGMFTPGDYALTVGSVINNTTQTLTNIKFSVDDGEGTGTATNLTRTVKYWTVGVETDGHGAATMSSTNPVQSETVNATTTSATIRVLEGTKVTWADSTPVTNYVFDKWQEKGTDGSYSNATPTADGIDAQHTYKAFFKQKTGTVTVTVKLDGQKDDKSTTDIHTVTLYQGSTVVGTAQTGKSGSYSFTNVPYNEGGTKYHVTVVKSNAVSGAQTYTALTDTAGKDIIFSGDNGDTKTVDAPYFTAIAATEGNGNASINFGGDDGTTKKTDYTDNSKKSVSFVVASGTQVTWQAHEDKANYTFDKWTEDNSTAAKRENVAVTSANKTFTAKFKKDAFNTYLYLTVNGDPYGETATDGTKDIQSVELVTAKTTTATAVVDLDGNAITPTYDDTTKVWKAEGVKSEGQNAYWRVKTVDGGVYFKDANTEDKNNDVALDLANNKAVVREPLFGVVIERGAGNDTTATYTPTLKAQTGSEAKTRIVTEAEVAATVDLNKKSGYTWSKWLSKKSASPANTDDLDTTNHGTSTTTTTADGTFALVKGYTAPTTGDDKDLHIKPVYTFTTTIVTKYKTDPTDVTKVEINDGTTTTTVNKETAGTGDHTGRYTASGLDPEKTYTIIVNGFPSTVTFDKDDAGEDVDVTIFKVTVEQEDKKDSTLTPDGKAYVKLGANATGASATSVYLPIGATTTTEATDETKVNLTAAVGDTNPVFRLYNKDNAATDNYDEILWNAAFTAPAGKTMTAAIATNTGTQTPNNLTIGGDDGMQADVTVTAYFLRQYDLTVSAVTTEDAAATNSQVKLTADPKGLGTVMPNTTTGQSVEVTKVDAKTYIKVEYVHGVGEDFKGWSYAEADGDLYSALKDDGTVDTTKRIAPAAIAAVSDKTSPVYFVPKKDGATLKAVVEPAKYTVQVKVNLDNTEYPYNDGDLKVWLYTDEATPKKVTELTYNTTDKVFKGDVLPGTYRVYVNGEDLTKDPVFTEAAKNISFNPDQAEGTAAGGGAAGQNELKKEINYYHVNLAVNPANTGAIVNKVGFGSTMPNGSTGTASKIYLAKTVESANNGVQPIDIIAGAYDDNNKTHFRFDKWEQTGPNDGATTPTPITIGEFAHTTTQEQETYKLPNEATLTATNDDGSFKITTGNQLTLTATFVQQYKVKVQLKDSSLGSYAEAKQKKNAAATTYTEIEVNVDKGSSAYIKGTVTGVDYAFAQWSIKADNGKGKFANNETLDGEGVIGYLAEDTFTPEQDSILELELWQAGAISKDGWEYDKADATKSVAGSGELKKMLWTPNNGQTPTEVWVVKTADLTSTNKGTKLTENTHYTVTANADGTTTFEFDEAYLKGLDIASYTATFVYTLGAAGHKINYTGWTKTGAFSIKATKQDLTKVDIQVKDGELPETPDDAIHGSATANVDEEDRNAVRYEDHTVTNVPKADLLYQWYYSDKEIVRKTEGSSGLTVFKDDPAGTANAKTAMEKGEAFLTNATATYGIVKLDGQTADNLSIASNDTLKGKYVFALVWVDDSSDVAQGAVITNAISVDYDAKITLRQDAVGNPTTDPVTDAKAGNYAVYLWPTDGGTFDVTSNKAIQATHVTGAGNDGVNTGVYSTKGSKLNANKSYHIYVLETEGMTQNVTVNYVQWTSGGNPVAISRTTTPPTYVDYYTVRVTDMSASSTFTHATTAKQANDPAAAETFTTYPTFIVTTPKGATINTAANAKGVLKGTAIGVKANALKDKTVGWDQDYTLAWQDKEGAETAFTDAASKLTQSSTTAVSTGYAYTNSLANKVDFTGRLTQNTYTIEGDVKDVGGKAINAGGGAIKTATLSSGEGANLVEYTGTLTPATGGHNAKVTFTVPRAAAEAYTLEATPTDGTNSTPKTTMKGYTAPSSATAPTTVNTSVKLGEVAAGTTGNDLKNRFTIFVAATSLKMKVEDGDNTTGHYNESSNPDAYVSAGHSETWVYANYPAWEKTITVTNTGNTELAVTLVLQKSTDGGVNWTDIYKTGDGNNKLTGDGSDTDTNGVQFIDLEDTFTLGLADGNKSKSFTVKVPDDLQNSDDVKYRFDFVTKDGRGGTNPANGPKMYFNLDLTIKPVTIGRVTTWNDDGTFRVQDHWLKEDAIRNGATEANLNDYYSANTPKNHNWAAETLKADSKKTTMDDLDKQSATVTKDNSDIFYRWYVGDPDAVVTLNKTTGALTCTNGKTLTEVTDSATAGGTAYTPTTNDHGKMLYLVAVGQRNATNAVMTPDKDTFHEDPVPIPYPATIRLFENKVNRTSGASERTQVSKDDGEKYEVWLWDTANGDFPENPSANGSKAIKATATEETVDGNAYSKYVTDVILYPDHNYQVWTSAAKKVDTAFYPKYTNITIDSVDHKDKDVDYYLVDVANTELSQNDYDTELTDDNIVANSQYFYKNADLTGDLEKPSAKMPAEGETAATLDVVNNYVLNNTEVTFGFGDRTLDYDLNWGGGMTAVTDKPTDTVSHKLTYKDAAKAAVTTELELRLYDVKAYVMGTVGYANYITMTLSDTGDTKYVFTTRDQTGEILAIGTPVTQINVSNTDYTTFRLPKANGYATVADVPTGDAAVAELLGYRTPHNNGAPSLDAFSMDVNGVANHDTYDVVLQGEGQAMTVQDDVNDDTKLDTGNASVKGGIASISGDEVTNLTGDKAIKQQITLNYNYGKDQFVTVNVTNTSKQDPMAAAVVLENVTFAAAGTGNSAATEIELIENTFTTPIASFGADDTGHIKLKIHSGLAVGEYHYSGTFSFMNDADADVADQKTASATYDLTVIVEPLTFNSVDITKNDDGTLIIDPAADKQYTVTRKKTAEDGENPDLIYRDLPNTTTTNPDANSKLVQDTDYGYQWISAPVSATAEQVKAALTWNNGTLTVGNANGVTACTDADATQKVYTPKDDDSGRNLFLVIYGKDNATGTRRNATHFALSPAQTNTYKGMVALKVDDAEKRGKDDADSADTVNKPNDGDGYEVWFISKNDATDKTKATWTKVDDEYAYVADLLPNDNGYSVEISRAKDDSKKVTLTGATIDGTNVKTTIDTTGSNVVEAPFFTVNPVAFTAAPYDTAAGEEFDHAASTGGKSKINTDIKPKFAIGVGTDKADLAAETPIVLSGQTVTATAPAMDEPDDDKAWKQDYTLTWQEIHVGDTDATVDKTSGVTATEALGTKPYSKEITAKTFIGGRLDQITYEIVGTIHGPTGNAKQVKNVTLTSNTTPAVIYYSDINTATAGQTGIQSGAWTKDNGNNGLGNNGDEVTFTVVKGTYTVTGYEDTNFTIHKVTVEGTDVASTPRNQKTFTKNVKELDTDKRIFDIYLQATGPKLTVNDKVTTTITATSELPDHNHQFADNNSGAHYYYKQLGSDGVFTLELSNPGNVDLKLKATEVYKVKTGTDYSDSTKLQNALTAGTTSKVTITNGSGTDTVDTNRTILTFTGLPAANDDVLVGKSVSHDGTTLANAGTITVSKDVYNKDDAIYVVKFASEYLTTDGAPAVTGPTVYYVLDLQVEPLPIKKVTAEPDPTKTDGTLRLKDFVATGDNANDGLNSVLVDHDRDNDPDDLMGAKTAGLVDGDISYVWYSAPTTMTEEDVRNSFAWNAAESEPVPANTNIKKGTQTNNGKTYKPTDAEQGLNFYLVAYRTDADKNASDFAVSDAVYAQVTIAMKAYRTGKVNKSDTEATSLLTEVNISTMVGEDKKTSNADTVTVTGVADNANVLTFNATKTDVTATGAADDPAAAKWYFKSWAVKPLTGDELDATDTSIETPVGGERLTMNYTATGKATVIGYFDKLPELKEDKGYNVEAGVADNKADRTFHYEPNDGSGAGKVQIWIQPVNGNTWKNDNSAENKKPKQLTAALMIPPAAGAGAQGDYELTKTFLDNNLWQSDDSGDYRITFFDMERGAYSAITATNDGFEGTPREGGYAGYDRSVIYSITEGEKTVIAKVTNSGTETAPVYWGQVKITNTALTDNENGPGDTATLATQGGSVRLFAIPKDGYAFAGWSKPDNEPNSKGKFGNTADAETPYTGVRQTTETVIATFRKGDFTPQANAKTSVYYGDDALQETNDTLVVSVTKDATATQNFSYALATEAELTTYLNGAARPANAYTTDGKPGGDGNPNTNVVPAWLEVNADATDNTKVNFTVKANTPATGVNVQKTTGEDGKLTDAEDELVVYLKVTEDNTGESKIVPVTINVMTSDLKIKTANSDDEQQKTLDGNAYLALFEAATNATYPGEGRKPDHEEKVYYDYFAYQNVHNKHNPTGNVVDTNDQTGAHAANAAGANRWDKTDGALNADYGVVSNGYWTVAPVAFDGTGPNGYVAGQENTNDHDYKFTFHYTGDPDDDADNYNYNDAEITLTIPALVPEMSLKFADTLKTTTQGGDPKALLTLTKGTHSGEVTGDGYVKDDADNHAPISLAYANEANRKDEHLTYLDEEPVFHVTLQKIGNLKRVELSAADVDGFETELPTITIDPNATTQTAEFDVKLTHMKDNAKLWAGTHTITVTAKGYYDDATGEEKFITATYELEIVIDPRLITAVDVTTEYNKTEPTDVTPTIEGDPTLNDKGEDTKGNTPIKDATVTWETEDAKNPVPVKETVTVEIDPNYKIVPDDIKPETELNGKNDKDTPEETGKNPDPNTEVTPEAPAEDKTDGGKITITQLHPILMFNDQKEGDDNSKAGPAVNHVRHLTSVKVGSDPTALGKVLIDLGAYSSDVYDVDVEVKVNDFAANGGVLTPELPEGQLLWPQIGMIAKDGKTHYVMDITGLDTSKAMAYVLRLEAKGTEKDGGAQTILATYELHLRVTPNSPPPSGGGEVCPCKVFYHVGLHGTTTDATVEDVSESNRPSKIPTVTALDGYAFRGWSLTNPATLKKGEKIELVDPKTVTVKGDAMTFYAVIVERPFHEHYVIGYPNGNFGPADNINRASVATIIARAILPDFVEGANYGNPGGYSDVSGHWAESAIAYCSKFDVFKGYTDGTFRPDQPITRQEFATVIARLDGELTAKDIPFDDIDEAGDWAMNGIYTSYEKGWVNGYTDGTFKPLNNIRRDEAVKVFNAYLNRGVDADGLADLHEYVHTGVASNNTENGVDEYMTWPDVPKGHWAYYEIVEAANDHEFTPDFDAELGYTLPEHWEKCWIDERWRYGDGPSGGDSAAMVSAGFQVWLH